MGVHVMNMDIIANKYPAGSKLEATRAENICRLYFIARKLRDKLAMNVLARELRYIQLGS